MRLSDAEARNRLAATPHGVLSTVHPERGVDAVPVVFVIDEDRVGIPVDTVKPKASTRLQRERNLEADPRATLLVEHWDPDDWSRLWWVRAELRHEPDPDPASVDRLTDALAGRFAHYDDRPFARVVVLRIAALSGWAAAQG